MEIKTKNNKFRLLSIIAAFLLITSIVITGCGDEQWVTITTTDSAGRTITITYQILNVTTTVTGPGSTTTVTTTDAGSTTTVTTTVAGSTTTETVTVTECPPFADLAIMEVDFFYAGQYIIVNQPFSMEVLIENVGQIASGSYELIIYERPDDWQNPPYQAFNSSYHNGLAPGETYTFVKNNMGVVTPGGYELLIMIIPADQNDPDSNNFEWEHYWATY